MRGAQLSGHDSEDSPPQARVNAVRALLDGIIDYAGLFPPAGLSMERAVANHAEYTHGPHAWMLGKFVLPATRLREFKSAYKALPKAMRQERIELSVIVGPDVVTELRSIDKFCGSLPTTVLVRSVELKAATREELRAVGLALDELPQVSSVFVEVPAGDPARLIAAVGSMGLCAKIRTGGVTPDAFPRAAQVVAFMRECVSAGVPFKATAGLHHPVCAAYPLTYAEDAPRAPMFGFLNVFLAACVLTLHGTDADALAVLQETSANAFAFGDEAVTWRDVRFATAALERLRTFGAAAFGSCSFTEPVAELEHMGALA